MTNIIFYRNSSDKITKINMVGHANYADSGNDIVCSSISSLIYNLLFGINEVLDFQEDIDYTYEMRGGYFYIDIINEDLVNRIYLLTESMFCTIRAISDNYSDNIRWEEKICL